MTCSKKSYRTQPDARRALQYMQTRGKGSVRSGYAYRCKQCQAWHLTSGRR
jgi:hypothetical protein